MQGKVKLFASLREAVGRSELDWELEEGATVAKLRSSLRGRLPEVGEEIGRAWIAVNQQYAGPESQLEDGDEVALFPPVSGG
jgi:molybdopterin converting factor subunit 1